MVHRVSALDDPPPESHPHRVSDHDDLLGFGVPDDGFEELSQVEGGLLGVEVDLSVVGVTVAPCGGVQF